MASKHSKSILVIGATNSLGQPIIQHLLNQGYQVRSLVPNVETARTQFGEAGDLMVADPSDLSTLNSAALGSLDAVIWVNDSQTTSPSFTVDTLLPAIAPALSTPEEKIIFDFCQPSTQLAETWGAVDDVVMGGVSQSEIRLTDTGALFTGNVSTANSGGFASVRTRNLEPTLLANYEGVQLRVKGDGNRYKFLLRTETKWDGTAYSYAFDTQPDTWLDIQIPFSQLVPVFRAKTLPDAPPIDRNQICSWQLMLSKFEYDGALNPHFSPGFFQLQIAAIKAYRGRQVPQWLTVQSDRIQVMQVETSGSTPRLNKLISDRLLGSLSPTEIAKQCMQLLEQSVG